MSDPRIDRGVARAIVFDELTLSATASAKGDIVVVWEGRASQRHPEKDLSPFFEQLLGEAAATESRRLDLHFQRLEHFNSATILYVMQLMQRTKELGITLSMRYAAGLKWQHMTFSALARLDQSKSVELIPI